MAGKIVQHSGGRPPGQAGTQPGVTGKLTRPERGRSSDAVDEAAALNERCPVRSHEVRGVVKIVGEPVAIQIQAGLHPRVRRRHQRPQLRVHMEGPPHVVVVGALGTVGKPAVPAVQRVVDGEAAVDVLVRRAAANSGQEGLHHDLEPHPVDRRIVLADHRLKPGNQLLLDPLRQLVPQQVSGQGQTNRQGGRLHLRLTEFAGCGPPVRVRRIGTRV